MAQVAWRTQVLVAPDLAGMGFAQWLVACLAALCRAVAEVIAWRGTDLVLAVDQCLCRAGGGQLGALHVDDAEVCTVERHQLSPIGS